MEDFERTVFRWSQLSNSEHLHCTLPHHSGPVEIEAFRLSEWRVERVSQSMYDLDKDDEFVIASELLEALIEPLSC